MSNKAVKGKATQRKVKAQKKAKNKGDITLKDMLVKILKAAGKSLNTDQIVMKLKKSNYRTASKNIKKVVGVRLYSGKEFLKTSPGMFTLKTKGAKAKAKVNKPTK